MKLIRSSYILIPVIGAFLSLTGCIDDNELDFPDDRSDEIEQSQEVFSLFDYFDQTKDNDCFSVIYPIELTYSNGIIVAVDSRSGLSEAINSQSNAFYISGVILPLLIEKEGVLSSIENKEDLKAIFSACEVPDIGKQLTIYRGQCFEFNYPITLIDGEKDVLIENNEAYVNYKEEKGEAFSPQFHFPINIRLFESDEVIDVLDYYHLLKAINSCEKCPDGTIKINPEFNGTYTFNALYKRIDLPITYKWYLNNDLIGDGSMNSDSLNLELGEGSYEICLKSFNPDCVEGSVKCRSFTVNRPCIELFFNQENSNENPYLYYFYADFALQNDIGYEWVVFKGNDFLTSEEEIPGEGDNKFIYEFDPGFYTVCLEKENLNAECQLAKYCIELAIE